MNCLGFVCILCAAAAARGSASAEAWTLRGALQYARTNAPEARIARQRVASAEAVLMQANSAFWPGVRAQSSYTRTDNPVSVFGMALNQRSYSPALDFNNVPDADDLNVRGILSIPLYAGGRNRAGHDAAKAGARASAADEEATRRSLEFEVARMFYTIVKTRRFTEAAQAAVNSFATNYSLAEKRLNAGTALKTELLDLEVRLGQAREDLIRAQNAVTLTKLGFKNLLGLGDGEIEILEDSNASAIPTATDVFARPELRALGLREQAAEADVRRARGGYLPRVDLFGQVEHDSGWEFNGNGRSYTAGVVAQWDLWDGNRTRGRVAEARANLEMLREEEGKLRLALQLEAEEAKLRLNEAEERIRVSAQTVTRAEESARLNRTRFEQGLALATQLIDAETALTAARVRAAEARADREIAMAALRRAYGLPPLEGLE